MLTVITPTGGRPEALSLLDIYLQRQTCQNFRWIVLDDCDYGKEEAPKPHRCDDLIIPDWRWRDGDNTQCRSMLALLDAAGDSPILVCEDDDWYGPDYVAVMMKLLKRYDLAGMAPSTYYNVRSRMWVDMKNTRHASLCSTGFKREAIKDVRRHCENNERMIDARTWGNFNGTKAMIESSLCVGIKGMPGRSGIGIGHRMPHGTHDPRLFKLEELIGPDYSNYAGYAA